jgi:hypothetical protein
MPAIVRPRNTSRHYNLGFKADFVSGSETLDFDSNESLTFILFGEIY